MEIQAVRLELEVLATKQNSEFGILITYLSEQKPLIIYTDIFIVWGLMLFHTAFKQQFKVSERC